MTAPSLVPRDVHAVVLAIVHLHDVPSVIDPTAAAVASARNDAAVNARAVGQTVEQVGVTLTHCLLVNGCRIGGVLQHIVAVIQVLIVISDIFCDPVINGRRLLIGGLAIQCQLGQDRAVNVVCQLLLLCGSGVP